LIWARDRANLTTSGLAKKVGVKDDTVIEWERTGVISLSQVDKVAAHTHTPVGYLFLPAPPVETLPVNDFRTVGGATIQPSPDLLDTVDDAILRQGWYRDYLVRNGAPRLDFVGSAGVDEDPVAVAGRMRAFVGWDTAKQSARTWEEAFDRLVQAIDNSGVLVMHSGVVGNNTHRPLDVQEFRGFALSDEYSPLIFVNYRDAKAAQMFTVAHELVHIWLGASGVSNLTQTRASDHQEVERFCNRVAAEFLVPQPELAAQWQLVQPFRDYVIRLCRYFKVSSLVIIRRLRDLEYIAESDFVRAYADALTQFTKPMTEKGGGGNFYLTVRSRLGRRFISAIVASTLQGDTPFREAFRLLGVNNSDGIHKLASLIPEAVA